MAEFNIINYMRGLTGYVFREDVLRRIAVERGVENATSIEDIDRRSRNLMIADMLMVLFTSPSNSGSKTKSHGDFSISIGGQIITDKSDIYALMMRLYDNPDEELHEAIAEVADFGGIKFLDW